MSSTPKFLIYNTAEAAYAKAEEEGRAMNLPFWNDQTSVTKYRTEPLFIGDGRYVLNVSDYISLTSDEESNVVDTFTYSGDAPSTGETNTVNLNL